jgi:hypothetical protein
LAVLCGGAAEGSPRVVAHPAEAVLGRDHEVRLELSGADQPAWRVSEGELSQADATHLVWRLPDSGTPRTALLLLWDAADARPDPTVLRLPLLGRTDLEVETEPHARVTVEIAGRAFGPRVASAGGKVKVPVQVPPGVETATVRAEANGRTTSRQVDLGLPPDVRLIAALSPHPIAPSGDGWLMAAGQPPLVADRVEVEVAGAELSVEHGRDPLLFQLTPRGDAQEVVASAALKVHPQTRVMAAAAVQAPLAQGRCPPSTPPSFHLGATAGGFLGTGAAKGFELSVLAGISWPAFPRWGLELEVGLRHTGFSQPEGTLGTLHSSINVLPISASARFLALRKGPWRMAVRAGLGVAPYEHRLSATYQSSFREGGTTWEVLAGAEGGYRVGRFEPFLSLGYAYSPRLRTPLLSARVSGPRALAGVRWWLPCSDS